MGEQPLIRLQHRGFGQTIRRLLGSTRVAERELAGIVADEMNSLSREKATGQKHKNEFTLEGDLREVGYLKLKTSGFSIRAYFIVLNGTIYMLHLDDNKRRTDLTDGTKRLLAERVRDVKDSVGERAS